MRKLALLIPFLFAPCMSHAEGVDLKATILDLQRQTDAALHAQSSPGDVYRLTKAATWLDIALDELYEDDRTGIVQTSIDQARQLLGASEASMDTPVVTGSEKVREDLWDQSAAMKQDPNAACAMKELAKLDVQLVWAGHEKWESGWSHAEPAVGVAENLAYDAQQEIRRCALARQKAASMAVAAAGAASADEAGGGMGKTKTVTLTVEKYSFSTDALFQFDKSGVESLVAGGARRLGALAASIKGWKSIDRIEIVGHTDRIGSDDYNQALSDRRAASVRDYLVTRGLPADKTSVRGMGETKPLVHCNGTKQDAALIACLQPNRRVEITVQGEK